MAPPLVSIVVAAYKTTPGHLLSAIDSALAQTFFDFEILVSDDSPTDCLRSVVASRIDPRLYYQHNIPSRGVASNHWQAFQSSRGKYIAILNHDDLFAPEFLAMLVAELNNHPDSVLAFCDHWIIDDQGLIKVQETDRASVSYGRTFLSPGLHLPFTNLLIAQTIPMAMGSVFRRSSLPETLPNEAGPAYDIWLTYLLARTGGGAIYVPHRLSSWRSHGSNLTSGAGLEWLNGAATCWNAVSTDSSLLPIQAAAQQKAVGGFLSCALRSWRDGRQIQCMKFAAKSLCIKLSFRGFVILFLLSWLPVSVVNFFMLNLSSKK